MNGQIPSLPAGCEFEYLDEGAANIVYRIKLIPCTPPATSIDEFGSGTPPPTEVEAGELADYQMIENKLMRIRKDLSHTPPCAKAQAYWEEYIQPRFEPSEIVYQSLFKLEKDLVTRLNNELHTWESNVNGQPRLAKRCGVYLANDPHGLLVTDMTPGQFFVEFKPKWLLQSPSAPASAKRCRTCALAARANARLKSGELPKSPMCPLDLVSSNPSDVHLAADLLAQNTIVDTPRLERWLQRTRLFRHLRDAQSELDRNGVLQADADDEQLRVAMTLRDCTAFVRFPENPDDDDHLIEARLGDLDLKGKEKAEYWRLTERNLIEEGWYEGNEREGLQQKITCQLSREASV